MSMRRGAARAAAGFTLLELMVVVVIVGILASLVVISVNVVPTDRDVERAAARFESLLTLLREEALMQTRDYGVLLAENGYRFYLYNYDDGKWLRVDADRIFAQRTFAEEDGLTFELELEGQLVELPFELPRDDGTVLSGTANPQIMVLSSGEVSPFHAAILRERDGARYTIGTDETNAVTTARDESYLR